MRNVHLITKEQEGADVLHQYLYITSDEEIKDVRPHKGKWQLEKEQILNKFPNYLTDLSECKLVIMTTDPKLIENGVQAIDDEFLEWFVKNPSCERVEYVGDDCYYEIIIPQEEPKQETLEEVAENHVNKFYTTYAFKKVLESLFVEGAKWQQEQDRWKTVYEETPPIHVELLVKSPEGIVHLSSWRKSYNIFSCQAKSESSLNWKWKTI
jgi:hypothetical protein